jgi:hypothetical protein
LIEALGIWHLAKVFGADLRGREEAEERRSAGGCLDRGPAFGFFAFNDADYGSNDHSGFARGLDCVDGGGAGGAYVIDNQHARAGAAKALDATTGAVCLFRLADEEAVQ